MKKVVKNVFYPHYENNHKPYFWHPISVTFFVLAIVFISGLLLIKNNSINEDSLLGDIRSGVLIAFTNEERKDEGLSELIENETLNEAARLKAQDMTSKGYFAHYSPDGSSPWVWFDEAGYEYDKAGENLAVNFNDSKAVVNAWMNSPAHRANIVKDGYTEIGIGISEGTYKGKKATFVVQLFAKPKVTSTSSLLTFAVEKKVALSADDQSSVRGAEISVFSLASVFEMFASQTYSLVILLCLITLIIIFAIATLVLKGKKPHTKQFYFSMFVLIVCLGISISTLVNFFGDLSVFFI